MIITTTEQYGKEVSSASMDANLKVLIIDDERTRRQYVRNAIARLKPEHSVYEAQNEREAIKVLEADSIDILMVNADSLNNNGLSVLHNYQAQDLDLILISSDKDDAFKAIEENAAGFLLRPIDPVQLKDTIDRIAQRRSKLKIQPGTTDADRYLDNRISLNHLLGIKFITLRDIVYFQAKNSYTIITLINDEKFTVSKPISRFEQKLDTAWFYRIHKSFIVNIFHFKEYLSKDGDLAIMDNGDKLDISRYRLNHFLKSLENTSGWLKI